MIEIKWKNLIKTYMIIIGIFIFFNLITIFLYSFLLWVSPNTAIEEIYINGNHAYDGVFFRSILLTFLAIGLIINKAMFHD